MQVCNPSLENIFLEKPQGGQIDPPYPDPAFLGLKINCVASSRIKEKFSKLIKVTKDVKENQYDIFFKHFIGSFILTDKSIIGVNFTFKMLPSKHKLN